MLRTVVAAPDCRPETSSIISHARAIPEASAFTTAPVTFTWHFYERAEHCLTACREESRPCSRILAQIKAMIGFISAYHGSNGKGKSALHGHAKLVQRLGDRLAAPFLITIYRAQIANFHDDAIERSRV
jgi:hypothetical protein